MGVRNLSKLIRIHAPAASCEVSLEEYRGKRVAVDANLFVYKFLHGADTHANGALYGFLELDRWFRAHGISAIYVFDGKKLEAKRFEIERRWSKRRRLFFRMEECKHELARIQRSQVPPVPHLRTRMSTTATKKPTPTRRPSAMDSSTGSTGRVDSSAKTTARESLDNATREPASTWAKYKKAACSLENTVSEAAPADAAVPNAAAPAAAPAAPPAKRVPAPPTPTALPPRVTERSDASKAALGRELATLKQQVVYVSPQQIMDCQQMLRIAGLPTLIAEHEAEATCAALCIDGVVGAVVTEDMDALAFGSLRVLRDVRPHKSTAYEVDTRILLKQLQLTQPQFVDLCILCGCDFAAPPRNISCHRALSLVQRHKRIEDIPGVGEPSFADVARGTSSLHVDRDAFTYEVAREIFLHPPHVDADTLRLLLKPQRGDAVALDDFLRKRSHDRSYGRQRQFGAHWNRRAAPQDDAHEP